MRKLRIVVAMALLIAMVAGCSHMSTTQQRALSGGAIGAGSGAALSLLTGGSVLLGTAIGAGVGTVGGLVYDDVLARFECRARLREVRLCRCRDDDDVDVLTCEQVGIVREHLRLRQDLTDLVAPATDDRGDFEPRDAQERRMEVPPRQPEPDQTDS